MTGPRAAVQQSRARGTQPAHCCAWAVAGLVRVKSGGCGAPGVCVTRQAYAHSVHGCVRPCPGTRAATVLMHAESPAAVQRAAHRRTLGAIVLTSHHDARAGMTNPPL